MQKNELVKKVEGAKLSHLSRRCPSCSHCGTTGAKTLEWAKKQASAKDILQKIDLHLRLWCIRRGFDEFLEHCDWDDLTGYDWSYLLRGRPEFAKHCDWDMFDAYDWRRLLMKRPEFADICDWSKIDDYDRSNIFSCQPQLNTDNLPECTLGDAS